MKIFCFFGLHNWLEVKSGAYWERVGKHCTYSHYKVCCNCDKRIDYV